MKKAATVKTEAALLTKNKSCATF